MKTRKVPAGKYDEVCQICGERLNVPLGYADICKECSNPKLKEALIKISVEV